MFFSSSLKTDLKSTNVDEVRLKMEMFYQEIIRLQNTKASTSTQSASSHAPKPKGCVFHSVQLYEIL